MRVGTRGLGGRSARSSCPPSGSSLPMVHRLPLQLRHRRPCPAFPYAGIGGLAPSPLHPHRIPSQRPICTQWPPMHTPPHARKEWNFEDVVVAYLPGLADDEEWLASTRRDLRCRSPPAPARRRLALFAVLLPSESESPGFSSISELQLRFSHQ